MILYPRFQLMTGLIGKTVTFSLIVTMCRAQATQEQPLIDLAAISWIHGAQDCKSARERSDYLEWQQFRYRLGTYIFRQNKCSHYEAPFVYLLVGEKKSLLIDTGATFEGGTSLLEAVRAISDRPLIVTHSHGHTDHWRGDGAFKDADDILVVEIGALAVQEFFGFDSWPDDEPAFLELGNRKIEVLPIPGHAYDHVAFYDRSSQLVITGDTLLPGRVYVEDWSAFRASIARLVKWVEGKPIIHVMGTHIEMSKTPNVDYPIRSTYQPNEHVLPLSVADISTLYEAIVLREEPDRIYLGDYIVWPR